MTVIMMVLFLDGINLSPPTDQISNPVYSDMCGYENYPDIHVKCGDQCIGQHANCRCGSDIFQPKVTKEHCCISSDDNCSINSDSEGVCSRGFKLPMTSVCNNSVRSLQCHNSYQDSQEIGLWSHYTCPRTCVTHTTDMCRGVSWCSSDVQECGSHLRCYLREEKFILVKLRVRVQGQLLVNS